MNVLNLAVREQSTCSLFSHSPVCLRRNSPRSILKEDQKKKSPRWTEISSRRRPREWMMQLIHPIAMLWDKPGGKFVFSSSSSLSLSLISFCLSISVDGERQGGGLKKKDKRERENPPPWCEDVLGKNFFSAGDQAPTCHSGHSSSGLVGLSFS